MSGCSVLSCLLGLNHSSLLTEIVHSSCALTGFLRRAQSPSHPTLTLPIRDLFTAMLLALVSFAGPGIVVILGVIQDWVPGKQERDTTVLWSLGFDGNSLVCKANTHHVGAQTSPEKNS